MFGIDGEEILYVYGNTDINVCRSLNLDIRGYVQYVPKYPHPNGWLGTHLAHRAETLNVQNVQKSAKKNNYKIVDRAAIHPRKILFPTPSSTRRHT